MSIDAISSNMSSQYLQTLLGRTASKPPETPDVSEIISNNDEDGDGSLSLEEFGTSDKNSKLFSEIDKDGDSLITAKEFQAHFDAKQAEMQSMSSSALSALTSQSTLQLPNVNEMISNRDEDGDGALSEEEFGADEEVFSSIDSDGDGLISAEELQADMESRTQEFQSQMSRGMDGIPPPPKAEDLVSELDEDEDGSLSSEEFGASEEVFSSIDTNEDGVISAEELQADMDKKAEEMKSQQTYQGLTSESLASLLDQSDSEEVSNETLQSLLSYLNSANSTDSTYSSLLKNYNGVDLIA